MHAPVTEPTSWVVVLPVKDATRAKTRLRVPDGVTHDALVRAVCLDVVDVVLACPVVAAVVVVTDDPVVSAALPQAAVLEPDPGSGLDAAVLVGAARAAALRPDAGTAALLADIPALRPQDLAVALAACGQLDRAVVPDTEGTGTVLLTATPGHRLAPSYGEGSARRHELLGASRVEPDLPRLRRDVDTWQALVQAQVYGLGPRTRAALA